MTDPHICLGPLIMALATGLHTCHKSTECNQVWFHPWAKWQLRAGLWLPGFKQVNSQFPALASLASSQLSGAQLLPPTQTAWISLAYPVSISHDVLVRKCSPSSAIGMGCGHSWTWHFYTHNAGRLLRIQSTPTMMASWPTPWPNLSHRDTYYFFNKSWDWRDGLVVKSHTVSAAVDCGSQHPH